MMPGRRRQRKNGVSKDKNSEDSTAPDLPDWFAQCKSRLIIEYDTTRFPFRELYADWLGVPSDKLDQLHTLSYLYDAKEPIHPKIAQAWRSAAMSPRLSTEARASNTFTQCKLFQSDEYHRLVNTYRLFIREVLAPLCNPEETNVVYQCPPTTRVVLPNGKRTIALHSDKEYKDHQPAEINFWVPVTPRVYGNNSLWIESLPGKGDYTPVELRYGQCLRFDGYDCQHYTVHNDTEACRVSFDFRVIPSSLCIQRQRLGEFCMEETTEFGCVMYPHPFWRITQGIANYEQEESQHMALSDLYQSSSLADL